MGHVKHYSRSAIGCMRCIDQVDISAASVTSQRFVNEKSGHLRPRHHVICPLISFATVEIASRRYMVLDFGKSLYQCIFYSQYIDYDRYISRSGHPVNLFSSLKCNVFRFKVSQKYLI